MQPSMDPADGNGDDDKSASTFRCINLVRYAVASAVTVLIATVVVIAIKTVVRPDTIHLSIVGGFVSVERSSAGAAPNEQGLQLEFTIHGDNPSGRAIVYYYNVTGYLFDKNVSASTPDPMRDSFVAFLVQTKALQQQLAVDSITQQPTSPGPMTESYFYLLYNNGSARIDGVTMRMDGDLVTEPISGYNTTARRTTYYCSQLVVARHDGEAANRNMQGSGGRCTTTEGGVFN